MVQYDERARRLSPAEPFGEGCAVYSLEPIDHLSVKVILPQHPVVDGYDFVNWYVGFGDPEHRSGPHVEAGVSFSKHKGWNTFFNPGLGPNEAAQWGEWPGPDLAAGEREIELTLIRRSGGGRVKFFVRVKGGHTIDLTPAVPLIRSQPSQVKIVSAARSVHTCSYGEVVMSVVEPYWYKPLPLLYRACGPSHTHGIKRIRVLEADPRLGFRTELPPLLGR